MTIKILLPSKICDVPGAKRTDIKMRKSWRSLVLVVFCSRVWLHCFLPSSQAPPRRALSHTQIGAATQLDAWSPVHTGDCRNQTSWGGAPQLSHQVTVLFAGFVGLCVCAWASVGLAQSKQSLLLQYCVLSVASHQRVEANPAKSISTCLLNHPAHNQQQGAGN